MVKLHAFVIYRQLIISAVSMFSSWTLFTFKDFHVPKRLSNCSKGPGLDNDYLFKRCNDTIDIGLHHNGFYTTTTIYLLLLLSYSEKCVVHDCYNGGVCIIIPANNRYPTTALFFENGTSQKLRVLQGVNNSTDAVYSRVDESNCFLSFST